MRVGGRGTVHLLMFTVHSDCVWAEHTPGHLLPAPSDVCLAERQRTGGHRSISICVGMAIPRRESYLFDTGHLKPKLSVKAACRRLPGMCVGLVRVPCVPRIPGVLKVDPSLETAGGRS